ncbi:MULTISPECIES: GNAT family N-acetyltransferase [Providencia]|nr:MULTISPECIES: GNAT family N-acetyltransferase [Providencia]ATG15037.1 N-acetyltransferase [Providencia alcalifaciens]EKT64388.1 acetyltransferase [Providencia alcalifaciens Dmel2]ETT04426.1 acetyltransferase (GNAT) domain protein [Providencia alcalifaciens F90-2004]EUC96772.1 acetyltransferase (GNAT) domain protein [Providencia alcalifaciens PAL-2]EUD03566.1 acetyltransferase (GNAT) domain protein [Providencia alcalifaciens RIMD 1656011]
MIEFIEPEVDENSVVSLQKVTAENFSEICLLSHTLSEAQRSMVADNAYSMVEAQFSDCAWYRGIYADDIPVGFIMLHSGLDDDELEYDGIMLWRFMIAEPYQKLGFGREALIQVIRYLKKKGYPRLYNSCGEGEESPFEFYQKLGFIPTGGYIDDECELVLDIASWQDTEE